MRLEMMKEHRERGDISSDELGLGTAIVAVVLGDDAGHVAEDEGRQVESKSAGLENANNDGEQLGSVGKEVLVVAGDACPPGVYVGAEGEGDEVVELGMEVVGDVWGGEQRGNCGGMGEQKSACEGLRGHLCGQILAVFLERQCFALAMFLKDIFTLTMFLD